MTIKLSNEFKDARQEFLNSVQNGESQDKQNELYNEMINEMVEDTKRQAREEAVNALDMSTADAKLTNEQRKFFNAINTEVGYKEDTLLPEETINKIFEDLTTAHPLLAALNVRNAGLRLKFLRSETSGVTVWGKIFSEIKGQLDAQFSDEVAIQSKMTAFVAIPKDLADYGAAWIERFVRTQIEEAFAVGLELAFLTGDGLDKPIGLNRQVQEGVAISGGVYPEKAASGTLTFKDSQTTVNELKEVMKKLSVSEDGQKRIAVAGKVKMVVNPEDALDLTAQYTFLNQNGVYVTAIPYNIEIIESVAQPAGKALFFVDGRYDAVVGGGVLIRKFDQTLALEDMDLFTAKQMAYGKAQDNNAALVYDLEVTPVPAG